MVQTDMQCFFKNEAPYIPMSEGRVFTAHFDKNVCSSEGEELAMNIGIMAARIGHAVRNNADKKKILVFFDAIDSGASIDRIQEFKDLLTLIVNDAGEDNIRIIIAANSFELARGRRLYESSDWKAYPI